MKLHKLFSLIALSGFIVLIGNNSAFAARTDELPGPIVKIQKEQRALKAEHDALIETLNGIKAELEAINRITLFLVSLSNDIKSGGVPPQQVDEHLNNLLKPLEIQYTELLKEKLVLEGLIKANEADKEAADQKIQDYWRKHPIR